MLAPSLLLVGCVSTNPHLPERTAEGLTRIEGKRADTVYTARGMTLAPYRRVMLDPVEIAFRHDWQTRHPEVTPQELARVRAEAAVLFREVFARELGEKGGYALTSDTAADVLRVTASVLDLEISTEQTGASTSGAYLLSPGDMKLVAELRDAQSGAILVRAVDHERGRESGDLRIVNQVTESAEVQKAFAMWAGLLRNALDAAR
jgi:hypothetical protein